MRNVFPLRAKPIDQQGYAAGWVDGCAYGERLARVKGRLEGTLGGLLIACALVALVYFLGGPL